MRNKVNEITPSPRIKKQPNLQINIRLITSLAIIVALLALVTLWQMHNRIVTAWENEIDSLEQILSESSTLGVPDDIRVQFSELENLMRNFENRIAIKHILVAKKLPDGTEAVVYPFYARALEYAGTSAPNDRPTTVGLGTEWIKRPLYFDGIPLGTLMVNTDKTTLNFVRGLAASMIVLLAALLVTLIMQLRRQQVRISQTTIEIEQKQKELTRMERMALAGQLTANLLHDLKKPVLNIRNDLDDMPELTAQERDTIRGEVKAFLNILGDVGLEKFVAPETEAEYLDVTELILRSAALVRYERKGCEFIIDKTLDEQNLPPVFGTRIRLVQVLSNIMVNAYQAMEGNGKLTASASMTADKKFIVIKLQDNGPGIPPEIISKIFSPFHTTKTPDKGTGLGLYIAETITAEHGGRIDVQSQPGETIFTIYLPVAPETT